MSRPEAYLLNRGGPGAAGTGHALLIGIGSFVRASGSSGIAVVPVIETSPDQFNCNITAIILRLNSDGLFIPN